MSEEARRGSSGPAEPPRFSGAPADGAGPVIPLPPVPGSRARRGRLSRSAEFDRVYRQGRSVANRWLVVYTFPRAGEDGRLGAAPRLGLSVSRKVGGAVQRNLVKRLVREAFDAAAPALPAAQDVVVVARPEARDLAEKEGLRGIAEALDELLAKAPTTSRER